MLQVSLLLSWLEARVSLVSLFVSIGLLFLTGAYVGLVAWTLYYIRGQFREQEKNRKLQTALTLYQELQSKIVRDARKYIYEHVPVSTENVADDELKQHAIACEDAVQMFHRVGYLLREGHIDPYPILENYWDVAWRCWQRTESLIRWSREKRANPTHFFGFEHLYNMCEKHRKDNNYEEPKFY